MNDATNPNPAASAPAAAIARTGSLKSTLKIIIPIGLLMAVVFGVTFFSQYAPPDEPVKPDGSRQDKDPPLRFASSTRHWDAPDFFSMGGSAYRGFPLTAPSATPGDPDLPFRFDLQNRNFPGFYEIQSDAVGPKNSANFWFENPHAQSVTMRLQSVSCTACSGGRVAAIPPDVTRQLLQMSGVSVLPQGLLTGLPMGMVGPAANLHPDRLSWQHYLFRDNPHPDYKIPPADNKDGWSPQWGILELQFSVGRWDEGATTECRFRNGRRWHAESRNVPIRHRLRRVNAFDLTRNVFDAGELTENSEPRKFEIIATPARGAEPYGVW